jgi:site-specific DNA-adenine methylase
MFYYYGRKKKIVKYYPKPIHDFIIEPFAGAAAYSMEYYQKNVFLFELNPKISKAWEFLIKSTPSDILNLPLLKDNQCLNDSEFDRLTEPEKYVIGLFLNPGSSTPKKSPGNYCAWNENNRKLLSEDVLKVKHWTIINDDYQKAADITATWFIDPPYAGNGGQYYQFGNKGFDYPALSEWVKTRNGQVIVCENSEATWMEFEPLVDISGQRHKTSEVIWYREN